MPISALAIAQRYQDIERDEGIGLMSNVIDFDAAKLRPYLMEAITGFLNDPPDSLYQQGYWAALINVYDEGLILKGDARVEAARKLVDMPVEKDATK